MLISISKCSSAFKDDDMPKTPNASEKAALLDPSGKNHLNTIARGDCLHLTTLRTDPAVRNK